MTHEPIFDPTGGNPFLGYDVVENTQRPTERAALLILFRWWLLLMRCKTVELTSLHRQLMRLEVECWKKNFHWDKRDTKDVYAYVALSANLFTFDERNKRVPDILTVESLLHEASLLCYLIENGISGAVLDTRNTVLE